MNYRGRFAPSPTGLLHAGSLVAALGSWLSARQARGQWLLRMEDLDPPREVEGSAAAILGTLQRFGLKADAPVLYQSARGADYQQAFDALHKHGHVFACWCSRADLAARGGVHHDGHCITPPQDDREPAWRIRVPDRTITFIDGLQGQQRQDLREVVGDFVLRRADGCWSYHLACVVDDAAQGMTEVVRGSDLLDSTARQIFLQQVLGLPTPDYLHLPIALREDGGKLSKSARDLPAAGDDPVRELARALAFLGQEVSDESCVEHLLESAWRRFDRARLPRSKQLPWPPRERSLPLP
jgi:glutamyl-Q tRNA(Asp) synthetase